MKKDNSKNIILDYQDVENKIKRISLEILEDNIDQKNLILFGVSKNGKIISKKIITLIIKYSKIIPIETYEICFAFQYSESYLIEMKFNNNVKSYWIKRKNHLGTMDKQF